MRSIFLLLLGLVVAGSACSGAAGTNDEDLETPLKKGKSGSSGKSSSGGGGKGGSGGAAGKGGTGEGGSDAGGSGGASAAGGPAAGPEVCGNGRDDDLDGVVDEDCACTPGATQPCYAGPPDQAGKGPCTLGKQTCKTLSQGEVNSTGWGPCEGSGKPAAAEVCGNDLDDNCDGKPDCGDVSCRVPGKCGCLDLEAACGDGKDDDCDGKVDCDDPDCKKPGECGNLTTESACSDGADDDADGKVDCDDPDCKIDGQCGCGGEEVCGDGADNDCNGKADCDDDACKGCVPGAWRFCDEPLFCNWGKQQCMPDRSWGACTEIPAPAGCEPTLPFEPNWYDLDCCVKIGGCCQLGIDTIEHRGNCQAIGPCQTVLDPGRQRRAARAAVDRVVRLAGLARGLQPACAGR